LTAIKNAVAGALIFNPVPPTEPAASLGSRSRPLREEPLFSRRCFRPSFWL